MRDCIGFKEIYTFEFKEIVSTCLIFLTYGAMHKFCACFNMARGMLGGYLYSVIRFAHKISGCTKEKNYIHKFSWTQNSFGHNNFLESTGAGEYWYFNSLMVFLYLRIFGTQIFLRSERIKVTTQCISPRSMIQ